MNNYVIEAYKIAVIAHDGQKRWNGDPYISHPKRVAAKVKQLADMSHDAFMKDVSTTTLTPVWYTLNGLKDFDPDFPRRVRAAAILHDVLEDTDITAEYLKARKIPGDVISAVKRLSRTGDTTYYQFIQDIRLSQDKIALIVKYLDIHDNMSDLKEGSLKDKYRFAYHLLANDLLQDLGKIYKDRRVA